MEGKTKFLKEVTRLLELEIFELNLESLDTRDDSYVTITIKGSSHHHVIINFKGDAGFIHFGAADGIEGPFAYSDDGATVLRLRDGETLTPKDFSTTILAYVRSSSSSTRPVSM